jgi:hypothetical protein
MMSGLSADNPDQLCAKLDDPGGPFVSLQSFLAFVDKVRLAI